MPDIAPEDRPIGGQLMGAEPGPMAQAAALMAARGFDVVDLNFACPVRKVLGRRRGGALLADPTTAIEIIRTVRAAVPKGVPVTLKLRRGMDGARGSERDFFLILDGAFEHGLAAVTVHGRTVAQRYVGPSDWGFLARVKRHVGEQTVLGSGDLFDAEGIRRMLEQTGVGGVTVARGCIGNPWIFREARAVLSGRPLPDPPTVAEQGRVIREHFELCDARHGPRRAPRIMRKFGIKYSELHPYAEQVRTAFIRSRCREDWLSVLDEWYAPTRSWPAARRKSAPGDLVAAGARR
jgi:nifR3 family TIM-barrel protein